MNIPRTRDIWALHDRLRVVIKLNDEGQPIGLGSENVHYFCALLMRIVDL